MQARIDGSPLLVKGRSKPFSQSRESEVAISLDDLDVPQMASYAPASVPVAVKSGKTATVFNIKSFRLITAIHYNRQIVYILLFLTHTEYERGQWKNTL